MAELADFQLAFAAALVRTGGGAFERQPGFAVYRNTTPNALIEVLRASYSVTAQIIGDDAFDAVALLFARNHPPANPVLLDYGAGFAAFLAAQPWIADELPYLADVAAIERLRSECHIAPDAQPLSHADLTLIGADAWPKLRMLLHPAVRFAWLRTPAMTIWAAHQTEDFDTLEPEWRAEGALFTRPCDATQATHIDAPAYRFLDRLRLGETIGRAASAIVSIYPDADIAGLFSMLIQQGAFVRPPELERTH